MPHWSLRTKLVMVAVLALLPVLFLSGWRAWHDSRQTQVRRADAASAVAEGAASRHRELVEGSRRLLIAACTDDAVRAALESAATAADVERCEVRRMLLGELDRGLLGGGNADHLVAGVAHDVGDIERDHRLVLDHQHAHRGDALQLSARLLQAVLGLVDVDAEDVRGVGDGEALEHGEQQHLALQGRHLGQRFLQPAADAGGVAALLEAAERLLQAMEQREHAELGVLGTLDQLGLAHRDFGAQAHPFVAALLRAGDGARVTTQERQRLGDCFG